MADEQVIFFTPHPLVPGQRIRITAGPRRGDWEVIAVNEHKLTLRCPVSQRQFSWERFCYHSETRTAAWPQN